MNGVIENLIAFVVSSAPYWGLFFGAMVLSLVLTPLCRELARKMGMVDKPSERRINKVPIPRGGGVAIYLAFAIAAAVYVLGFGGTLSSPGCGLARSVVGKLTALGGVLCLVGLVDDKFSLPPLVKLLAQVVVAVAAHCFCGVGFASVFPAIPEWIDLPITVFWIVGAVNAFNLIDGLDGLATGLAVIATIGMAGALFFVARPENALVHFAFCGACLGFLRYNFHPASVFLGDSGSMNIGFFLSAAPLVTNSSNSMFISLGVPLLAMGVPIFDTSLAILRRSVRAVLKREEKCDPGNDHVMQPDTDHLHHRILRKVVSQRKAALALYAFAAFFVLIGLGGVALKGRAVALYIVGFMVAAVIVFRDMRRIELWDAARLIDAYVHDNALAKRRKRSLLATPLYLTGDVCTLVASFILSSLTLGMPLVESALQRWLPLRVIPVFLCLVLFRAYNTVWGRAQLSNYVRLAAAPIVGTAVSVSICIMLQLPHTNLFVMSVMFTLFCECGLFALRMVRPFLRDLFYQLGSGRLGESSGVSRTLVYGAGLRYRSFRRELVRGTAGSHRMIVGLLDDDILLRGRYIGGMRVMGTLEQADSVAKACRADSVVIACQLSPERLRVACDIFRCAGLSISMWECGERVLNIPEKKEESKCTEEKR